MKDETHQLEGLLTKKAVAEKLQVTPRTIDNWMALGLIPYIKAGRMVRFRWQNVVESLERKYGRNR